MEQELTQESAPNAAADWYTEKGMKTIDVTNLPPEALSRIEQIIEEYRHAAPSRAPRRIGWAKDVLPPLPESFFEELPEEVLGFFGDRSVK